MIYEGRVASLKRFAEDVKEVRAGYECGVGLEGFGDFKEGDIIELYREERVGWVARLMRSAHPPAI